MITAAVQTNNNTKQSTRTAERNAVSRTSYGWARRSAAALMTLGAAAIHFGVAPDHLNEYLPFGIFFILVGLAQVALAVAAIVRPGRRVFAAAALVAAGCMALWLVSRTVGLPIGPEPWKPEAMGTPDIITGILEALSALIFGILLWRGPHLVRSTNRVWLVARSVLTGLAMLPVTLLVVVFSAYGTLSGLSSMQNDMNMSTVVPGRPAIPLSSLTEAPGSEPVRAFTLTAEVSHVDGYEAWTYNGTVPGPELRVTQGDRVRVTLVNHLPASTTIHWHGLTLPDAEDGVAGVTQDAVPTGGTYTYEFVVNEPGTYWYHSHQDTSNQVPRGLYGALVVEPKQGPAYDHDYTVAIGDLGGGQVVAANGITGELHLNAKPGETVRLRIINATQGSMVGTPEQLALFGAPYKVIALDGHDLNQPGALGPEQLPVGEGQRYDLAFTMPASGQVRLLDALNSQVNAPLDFFGQLGKLFGQLPQHAEWVSIGDGPDVLPSFAGSGPSATLSIDSLPIFDLTGYGAPSPDPLMSRTSFDVDKQLVISNDHGFYDGSFAFIHMINGKASPNADPIIVRPGQVVRLTFVNDTDFYHPMHIHGHVFTVLSKNGKALTGSPVHQDSVLIGPHETWQVAFVADNPGLWMIHCHVLIHAASGLSMMLSYEGISTPYDMGPTSGNTPE